MTIGCNIPSTIPIEKRRRKAQIIKITLALIFLISSSYFCDEKHIFYTCGLSITVWLMLIMVAEVLHRLCLVIEEVDHVPSRYDNRTDIFKNAFKFSPEYITVFIFLLIIVICICFTYGNPLKLMYQLGWPAVFGLISAIMFNSLLRPKYGPLYQAISIGNMNGLDYGSAMACSFFHGYLKIVLPDTGTEQKGIKELMNDFQDRQRIRFEYDRLLVLIPLSLYCPPSMEKNSAIVELAQSLQDIQINRAGVGKRSYKSTAYKIIKENGEKVYVCVEYATPLQTLYETIHRRNQHAGDYEIQRKELALQFYLKLQDIINNDPDCKDCCDLIFFDDKTANGDYVDVGKVVLEHLANIKKNI